MKLERNWLYFGILGMVELQLETSQQVCIPLIPLKEIPSQIKTSWVEIVSKSVSLFPFEIQRYFIAISLGCHFVFPLIPTKFAVSMSPR